MVEEPIYSRSLLEYNNNICNCFQMTPAEVAFMNRMVSSITNSRFRGLRKSLASRRVAEFQNKKTPSSYELSDT